MPAKKSSEEYLESLRTAFLPLIIKRKESFTAYDIVRAHFVNETPNLPQFGRVRSQIYKLIKAMFFRGELELIEEKSILGNLPGKKKIYRYIGISGGGGS